MRNRNQTGPPTKERMPDEPPRWAQRLLSWYCRPELLEDLQGDLNEYFERNLHTKGSKRARLIYAVDVLKFFRSYTLRKPSFINLFIQWIMIGSYLKTSQRSLVRNKLFSFINIFGLAVSMSVGLLVLALLTDLLSYDGFHEKKDRIYRITTKNQLLNQPDMTFASTSIKAGYKIRETIPGIEDLTLVRREFSGDAEVGETIVPLRALWADQSFFKVFTFPLLQGDPATALREPNSLVLTEKTAKKLFGEADALGKTVQFDTLSYTVTGILRDLPKRSHIRFEALVSFTSLTQQTTADADGGLLDWNNIFSNYAYLVLPENANKQTIQASLDKLSAVENAALKYQKITLALQPLDEIALGKHLTNEIGPGIPGLVMWILGGLALVVILSACFNYTNLSIARSLRRSREVGIRKVMGALKGHVLGQFIVESVIISLLALVFSFGLFLVLRPQLLALNPFVADLFTLELSPRLIVYFLCLAAAVGILAGFMPALFFSRIKAIQVLKDASSLKVFRHVNMRKALIVIQYTFSLIFIAATIIGYNQYKGFISFDLGFTTENILNIRMQGNKSSLLKKELLALPAVRKVATSRMVTSLGSLYGTSMKYKKQDDSASVWLNFVDENYLPMHRHKFIAGTNFTNRPVQGAETEAIVNEQALKRFNIANRNPAKALGELITMDGKKLTIVGVLKDFHYGTMENKIEPMVFRYSSEESSGYLNISIKSTDYLTTLASIENAWRKIDKVHPLDAKFYDDQIEQAYSQFSLILKVIGFITFLAICIASMGLFGMVVFTTETRLKEVSIRKVMGASEVNLFFLLSKGFLLLLIIASFVALPATYLFFDRVILSAFAYHQPISLTELLTSFVIVMLLAILLIGSQTIRAARSNPAHVLKNE